MQNAKVRATTLQVRLFGAECCAGIECSESMYSDSQEWYLDAYVNQLFGEMGRKFGQGSEFRVSGSGFKLRANSKPET
jgi:hypothetical protein